MNRFFLLLVLTVVFFSCGDPKENPANDTAGVDLFRENVMTLKRNGLLKNIPEKQLDSLIGIYRKDSLNGLKELLVHSGDVLPVNIRQDTRTPQQVYADACRAIGKQYPELASDTVESWFLPEDPGGKDTGWMMMRMWVGDVPYTNKLYWFRDWQVDETFCKIYNTRLAAEKKEFRLYLVTFQCTDCFEPMNDAKIKDDIGRIGILKLTKPQADSLLFMEGLALDPEDEFTMLSPQEKGSLVKKFEATGLLSRQDSSWYRYRRDDILNNTVYGVEQMYDYLDTLFAIVSFDTVNDYNPYEQILKDMRNISRGRFSPDGISDEPVSANVRTVRFSFKGKIYEREMEQHAGILDPSIIDDVNKALEEEKIPGAFYTVLTRDNICLLVYIDNDKVEKAKASGFFVEFEKGASTLVKGMYNSAPVY